MPLSLDNDSSSSIWLENWSASCFWKPVPQPKKVSVRKTQKKFASNSQIVEAEFARPKKSVRKVPTSNIDNSPVAQASFEFEKPKRSFRKVSTSQSVEPLPAMDNSQVDLEKVKRGLRKVHNPVVENSIQPQVVPQIAIEKPNAGLEETVNAFNGEKEDEVAETVVEQQPEELIQTHKPLGNNEALDSTLVNQIEESEETVMAEEKEDAKEERTPKQNHKENSAGKENQKSGNKASSVTTTQTAECQESGNGNQTSSPGIPSYMQATKSAKAKLRLQGSSSPRQLGTAEKASRRYSLPSSGNSARVTSHSPKTRVSHSGGKNGNKTQKPLLSSREGNSKCPKRNKICHNDYLMEFSHITFLGLVLVLQGRKLR